MRIGGIMIAAALVAVPSVGHGQPASGCASGSAELGLDLDGDGVEERIAADACTGRVEVDGTAVVFDARAPVSSSPPRFTLREWPFRPHGRIGALVIYSNLDRCAEGSEDHFDYSACFARGAVLTRVRGRVLAREPCDESTTANEDLDGDGSPEVIEVNGCTGIVSVDSGRRRFRSGTRRRYPLRGHGWRGVRGDPTSAVRVPGRYTIRTIRIQPTRRDLYVTLESSEAREIGLVSSVGRLYRYTGRGLRRFPRRPRIPRGHGYGALGRETYAQDWPSVRTPGDGTVRVHVPPIELCRQAVRREHRPMPRLHVPWSQSERNMARIRDLRGFTVPAVEEVLRLDPRTLAFVSRGQRRTGGTLDCGDVLFQAYTSANAACPYVYVDSPDGLRRRVGEILRHLREPSMERWQSLSIGRVPPSGVVTVVLAEEKPETTHLDAIVLEVDEQRLAPTRCESGSPPAYCEEDRRRSVIRTGEQLVLEFRATPGSLGRLWARGYYVPDRWNVSPGVFGR